MCTEFLPHTPVSFQSRNRFANQNALHSTAIPKAMAQETREIGDLGEFCYDGIQLAFFPVPQNYKHLNRPNLGLRICKEASEFYMPLFLRTVCTGLFLGWNGIQFVPWSMRIDSPCHLLPASITAVILAKHTPLPSDSSGEQLAELSSWNNDSRALAAWLQPACTRKGPCVHLRAALCVSPSQGWWLWWLQEVVRVFRGICQGWPTDSHSKSFLVTWALQEFRFWKSKFAICYITGARLLSHHWLWVFLVTAFNLSVHSVHAVVHYILQTDADCKIQAAPCHPGLFSTPLQHPLAPALQSCSASESDHF